VAAVSDYSEEGSRPDAGTSVHHFFSSSISTMQELQGPKRLQPIAEQGLDWQQVSLYMFDASDACGSPLRDWLVGDAQTFKDGMVA
jgi:hypothetical protein